MVTLLFLGCGAFVCLGFWCSNSEWNATVLGRYTLPWFVGSLVANAAVVFFVWLVMRAVWQPTAPCSKNDKMLSHRKRLLFGSVAVCLTLLGIEILLRVLGLPPPRPFEDPLAQRISALDLKTSQYYHPFLQVAERTEEDGVWHRTYRGRRYEPAKSTAFRIVCLGGSTTYCPGEPEDAWPTVLETLLRDQGHDVEVINAGRAWYTTAHSLVNYTLNMRHFSPDIVIVMHGVNDLARSCPRPGEPGIERDYGGFAGPMSRLIKRHERSLADSAPDAGRPIEWPALYRALCQYAAFDRRFYSSLRSPATDAASEPAARVEDVGLGDFPTAASYRANLEYLTNICLADGLRVVLATQAHWYSRSDLSGAETVPEGMRRHFLRNGNGVPFSRRRVRAAMRAIREMTIATGTQLGVSVVDAERVVGAHARHFQDDWHLTVEGNAAVAEAFGQVISPMLRQLKGAPSVAAAEAPASVEDRIAR